MRIDREGRIIRQITVWLPDDVVQLIRADRVNLSAFIRQQLEIVYSGESPGAIVDRRMQSIEAARESLARAREAEGELAAGRERAREVACTLRAERDAAQPRQDGIAEALLQIVGDGSIGRYRRMLPENDTNGDHLDDWEALVRRISRLCGAEIDSAEVAAGLRALVATASPADRKKG